MFEVVCAPALFCQMYLLVNKLSLFVDWFPIIIPFLQCALAAWGGQDL